MRKIVDTFPGGGFPSIVGGPSAITCQFTFGGTLPLIGNGASATAFFGGIIGGATIDLDDSVLMGLTGVAIRSGEGFDGEISSTWWEFIAQDEMQMSRNRAINGDVDPPRLLELSGACAMEFNGFPVQLQEGTVFISAAAKTASFTLATPVLVGSSAVVFRGTEVFNPSTNVDEWFVNIYLTDITGGNYTTITAAKGSSGGSDLEVHWTILAFQAGANVNVQQVEAIVANIVTTNTITAVDPAKTVIWMMGIGNTAGPAASGDRATSGWIELTDSTTVTTRRSVGDVVALHQWINILEFN